MLAGRYELSFQGGIRLQAGTFGTSRVAYNTGPIAVSENGGSLWIAGHTHHFSIARYELPAPVFSRNIEDYPIAPVVDGFVKIDPPVSEGNLPTRVTGIELFNGALVVNVAEYYDADADNLQTTVVFDDAWNLTSTLRGYFRLQGATHSAGWMSEVPDPLKSTLGAPYLAGFASNLPINSRSSMGPSLFLWDPAVIVSRSVRSAQVPAKAVLDYSLSNPLHHDLGNRSGANNVWTHLSAAVHGFFVPEDYNYLVLGSSGGHESGVGYKIKQDNGTQCAGYCAYDHLDTGSYYWLYKKEEIIKSNRGTVAPHSLRPFEYGYWPVFTLGKEISGADFEPSTKRLYLMINDADPLQSRYERQPVLLVYNLELVSTVDTGSEDPPTIPTQEPRADDPAVHQEPRMPGPGAEILIGEKWTTSEEDPHLGSPGNNALPFWQRMLHRRLQLDGE
ncbi:MAG: hypothetical protein ACX93N_07960 [Pseudohaliea sp.]